MYGPFRGCVCGYETVKRLDIRVYMCVWYLLAIRSVVLVVSVMVSSVSGMGNACETHPRLARIVVDSKRSR